MRSFLRIALVVALGLQGWRATKLTQFQALMDDAEDRYDQGEGESAVDYVVRALQLRHEQSAFSWLGDMASYVFRHAPAGGWPKDDADALIELAWEGYAGAALRCPVDSWAWSGLADTALSDARRTDRQAPLQLGEIERRSAGILNGRYAVALAAAQLGVQLQPSGYQQLDVLARVYEFTGEIDKARATYALSARMMPAPSFHIWGSGRRLVQSLYSVVLENLNTGLEQAPAFEKSMLHLDVARFARAQGDALTALQNLTIAKAAAPDRYWKFEVSSELASLYDEQGKFAEALVELDVVIASGYGKGDAFRKSATLHARLQHFEEACARFRLAVREQEHDEGLRAEASRACEEAGDLATAEQFLKDGIQNPSTDLNLARALLDFYRKHDKDRTADSIAAAWARDFPDSPELRKWQTESARVKP